MAIGDMTHETYQAISRLSLLATLPVRAISILTGARPVFI